MPNWRKQRLTMCARKTTSVATSYWWTSAKWPRRFMTRRWPAQNPARPQSPLPARMSPPRNNLCNRPRASWPRRTPITSPRRLDRSKCRLQNRGYAPVSGEVNKTVVVGLNIQPGQQLLTVVPLNEVWVTANFKETQLRRMRVGQKAEIHVDSSGKTLKGHVDSIAGATGPLFSLLPPENATGNYVKIVQRIPVKIVLEPSENRDRQLRPGMNVVPDVYLQ